MAPPAQSLAHARYRQADLAGHLLQGHAVDIVEHGQRPRRFALPTEQAFEQHSGLHPGLDVILVGDAVEEFLVVRLAVAQAIAPAVQAEVGGHPVQQAGRVVSAQPFPSVQQANEDVLGRIEGFLLIAQKLATPAYDHGSVPLIEGLDIHWHILCPTGWNPGRGLFCHHRPAVMGTIAVRRPDPAGSVTRPAAGRGQTG
jgi:hypothetical protein